MKTIKTYLCASQVLLQLVLIILFSGLLYAYVRKVLVSEFDANLHRMADALTQKVKFEKEHGRLELEIEEVYLSEFDHAESKSVYLIRDHEGKDILRSAALERSGWQLPASVGGPGSAADIVMPGGSQGRYLIVSFSPNSPTPMNWSVLVLRERGSIDHALSTLLAGCAICGIAMIGLSVLLSERSVQRGLKPLRTIGEEVGELDASNLSHRFETERLPGELLVIGEGLNDLLCRLEGAFAREHRFAGNAAHELRTPLAELKAIVQVGTGWHPKDLPEDDPRRYFTDAESTIQRMERLVVTLLSLIRHEPGEVEVTMEKTDLVQFTRKAVELPQGGGSGRTIHVVAPDELIVMADTGLLHGILTNLLANSREYSPDESEIQCVVEEEAGYAVITLQNTCENVSEEDMDRLWEPFWRGSSSRSDPEHQGLGMSLVATYATCMKWRVAAALPRPDCFEVKVSGIKMSR